MPHSLLRHNVLLLVLLLTASSVFAQLYRPGSQYRSLNTAEYEIAIQKNGRLDVATTTGEAIFLNAFPMVWYADEDEPDIARLDGRYSRRFEVNDRLGRGQGMRVNRKQFEWKLRAYPTKPFFAVQFNYINDTKKPVQIKALLPWCVGDPKKGSVALGAGTPNSIMLLDSFGALDPKLVTDAGVSENMISVFNPGSGRSLLAGFVTQQRATGSIEIKTIKPDKKAPNQFDFMRAMCVYDPPITVYPGEVLESELLYIAVSEPEPVLALERYTKGVAVTNEVPNYMEAPRQAVRIARGDESFESYRAQVLSASEEISAGPLPTTDIELVVDVEWSSNGIANLDDWDRIARQLKTKGFEIGLYFDPFSPTSAGSDDWLIESGEGGRVLDMAHDGARGWLLTTMRATQQQLRFDSIWGLNPGAYLSAPLSDSTSIRTKVEMAHHAMDLLRTAVARTTKLNVLESGLLPVAHYGNVITDAFVAHRFFQAPHLGFRYVMPQSSEDYMHPARALATGTQQVFRYEDWSRVVQMINESPRFFPTLARPSKPQGAFFTESPEIWLTRQSAKSGAWILATALNHGQAARPATLPIPSISPRTTTQYALFDLDQLHYYGRAANQVNINVPGNSARTLLLREYRGHPTVLGTSRSVALSTPDRIPQSWSPGTLELTGAIEGDVIASDIFVLTPDALVAAEVTVEGGTAEWSVDNGVVKITIPGTGKNRVDWSIRFARR